MNFCTLFLRTENIHLAKDVGQIPYWLQREFGYHAYVATYKNGEYPFLQDECAGLELEFVEKSLFGTIFDGIKYIFKNRKKIDVLNVYHLNLSSFVWILFFKLIRKKNALIYLKLDADHREIDRIKKRDARSLIKRMTLCNADIISAESSAMKAALQKYCNTEILYLPNCYMQPENDIVSTVSVKENIILTVGRLGTVQKATEVLVDAFGQSLIVPQWKLVLIGPMEKGFKVWLERYKSEHPEISDYIIATGNIQDKNLLQAWYQKAKIFVLPSRWESFGIVLIEAMAKGCYLIASDKVLPAHDLITDNYIGRVFPVDVVYELKKALVEAASMVVDWDLNSKEIAQIVEQHYMWANVLKTLDNQVLRLVKGEKEF